MVDNWKTAIRVSDFQSELSEFCMKESDKIVEVTFKTESYIKLYEEFMRLSTSKDETVKSDTEQRKLLIKKGSNFF